MPSREIKSLDQMMDGALLERFNQKMAELWDNVFDPNTDPKKTRSITVTFYYKPNARRDSADMTSNVETKLAGYIPLSQTILLERHDDGSVTAIEHTNQVPGQIDMAGETHIPNVVEFNRPTSQL